MTPAEIMKWRRYARGLGWLAIALLGALIIDRWPMLADTYTGRWLGSCLKAATGAWGGYRVSRDICRIDPSRATTDLGHALLQLARALVVVGITLAVCLAL